MVGTLLSFLDSLNRGYVPGVPATSDCAECGHYKLLWNEVHLNAKDHGFLPNHLEDGTELTLVYVPLSATFEAYQQKLAEIRGSCKSLTNRHVLEARQLHRDLRYGL